MRRRGMIGAAAVLLLVVAGAIVAATSGTTTDNESAPMSGIAEPAFDSGGGASTKLGAPAPMTDEAVRSSAGVTGAVAASQVPVPAGGSGTIDPAGPRIVRTADVAIKVGDGKFGGAFDRVNTIATSAGGYVTSSSTASTGEAKDKRARSGQLTVRVPSDRFQDVRTSLGQLGEVENESVSGADVSGQLVDYDARLRSLQAQEESLRVLVGKATNVGEVLQVQNSLFAVRQQIEQLQAQRLQLDQAASLATIQLSLYEPGALVTFNPEPQPAAGLADNFQRAVDGTIAVLGGMLVVLGYLLPIGGLGLLVWGGARLRRRAGRPATPAPVAS